MTPDAYRSAIERLGLSQVGAGEFLGASERTSRRWAADGAPRSVELALLASCELMDFGWTLDQIQDLGTVQIQGQLR